jgi:hypothetical protein
MRALLLAALCVLIGTSLAAQAGSKQPPGFGKQGKVVRSGGDSGSSEAVDPEELPNWNKIGSDILDSAARDKMPIVVYFPNEGDNNDASWIGKELALISKDDARFVKFAPTDDREPNAWPVETNVPQCKLLSENPSRDFNIGVGKTTVVLCDWFGNEVQRFSTPPAAAALKSALGKVADEIESRAKTSRDAGNRAEAVKSLLKNFKDGYVGLEAQVETISLYTEIVDEAKAEAAKLAESADKSGLQALLKEMKGTDAQAAIEAEIKKLK